MRADLLLRRVGIYVDKATYKKYRAAPSLRQAAKKFIQINPAARDHFQFALVKIRPDKRCPFLSTTNLWEIQRQHGDEFLSKTCRRYPCALTRLEGKIQRALFLSCPEAARLVLLSSQLLPTPEQPFYQWAVSRDGWNGVETETRMMTRSLQAMAVDVLRDHSYPLWQRLYLLGTICLRAREFPAGQVKWKLPALVSLYASIISQGQLRSSLDAVPSRPEPQLELVHQLLQRRFQMGQPETAFRRAWRTLCRSCTPMAASVRPIPPSVIRMLIVNMVRYSSMRIHCSWKTTC